MFWQTHQNDSEEEETSSSVHPVEESRRKDLMETFQNRINTYVDYANHTEYTIKKVLTLKKQYLIFFSKKDAFNLAKSL